MSTTLAAASKRREDAAPARPRLGFLGTGWIGRHRLDAIARAGVAEVAAVADASEPAAAAAASGHPRAAMMETLEQLLAFGVDGVVLATPSALHAAQSLAVIARGLPVFCQKPLGRTAEETRAVIRAARAADLLLGVDLSYRFISGVRQIHDLCRGGELGEVFAVELTFHNAYGPDKPWFYDVRQAGGGCVLDLGIHLMDLALWNLNYPGVRNITSRLFAQGKPLRGREGQVEDYAEARVDLETGAAVRLACSWKLPAGREAEISGRFYGTKGGAGFRNVDGSFYNFVAEKYCGTRSQVLSSAPEEWGGRAAVDWARRVAGGERFDPQVEHLVEVAQVLDGIYRKSEA